MAAPVLTLASPLLCAHGGHAIAGSHGARVQVQGVPVLRAGDRALVAGCVVPEPAVACVALKLVAATRVYTEGQPVALALGAIEDTTGAPAHVLPLQSRVVAT